MTLVSKTFELYGKTYTFESGELAKQATGACLVKQGDTTMLDTVVVSKERKNYDFFPLTVDFNEKMYAAGRIPGGYLKREGRPSEKATLTARMIDQARFVRASRTASATRCTSSPPRSSPTRSTPLTSSTSWVLPWP